MMLLSRIMNSLLLFQYDSAPTKMGWEGSNARNPILSKVFLELLGNAMANGKGIFCNFDDTITLHTFWVFSV